MRDCYTLSLLSLSLTLSIIIMIISTINAILEEKEKATRWEGGFTNKTVWTCYMHVIFIITFCLFVCLFVCLFFDRFLVKNYFLLEFTIVFANLVKIKTNIYLKKKKLSKSRLRENTDTILPVYGKIRFRESRFFSIFHAVSCCTFSAIT